MDEARWEKVGDVFREARERPPDERVAFVRAECEGDAELRDEVLSLLGHHADDFLESSPIGRVLVDTEAVGEVRNLDAELTLCALLHEDLRGRRLLATYRDRQVVLDVMHSREHPALVAERFRAMAASFPRDLAGLSCPVGAGFLGGLPCFVSQAGDGTPGALDDAVSILGHCERRDASLAERGLLFELACRIVGRAHERGHVHGDLGARDILIDPTGSHVHVLGWGISAVTGWRHSSSALFLELRGVAGSPATLSPEQSQLQPVDSRVDVYSLGVLLGELLTGAPPVSLLDSSVHVSATDNRRRILGEVPTFALPGHGRIASVVRKAVAKDRASRHAHAGELALEVETWRGSISSG